ncbi:MAG: YfcE family phosphodiesterase [Anaerolineales bacterium]
MKVALIGDVHANFPALVAVIDHAEREGAAAIWNVGDFVGYGAFPEEVVRYLRQREALSIVGNYDLKVLKFKRKAERWRRTKRPEKYLAFQWAYEQLSPESRRYLRSLSRQMRLRLEGYRILLVHGSPDSVSEHLTPETSESRLRQLAKRASADLILCGHSHRPFVRKVQDVWFVNTGSVGRPEDGDPRATYALLDIGDGRFVIRHYRVAYDLRRAADAIHRQHLPEAFVQMLVQARDLDTVLETDEVDVTLSPVSERELADSRLQAVLQLGERYHYDEKHAYQVMTLALQLFDQLQPLHALGEKWRFRLQCAALLHEIGWKEGYNGHHKAALRLLLKTSSLPLKRKERRLVGLVARYHRRALPRPDHKHFSKLSSKQQQKVRLVAALLRIADGLDYTRRSLVRHLSCSSEGGRVVITCTVQHIADAEQAKALEKAVLFEVAFNRSLDIRWQFT